MTVFKACIKILKKNFGLDLIYIGIFTFMMVMTLKNGPTVDTDVFQAESMDVGVIDLDHSELSEGLIDHIKVTNEVFKIKNNESDIQNSLFNREVEYIVRIPEKFQKDFENGEVTLPVTKVPDSTSGYYMDQVIDNYMNQINTYLAADYTMKDAITAVNELPVVENVEILSTSNEDNQTTIHGFYGFAPFVLFSIICFGLGSVYTALEKEEVKKRMIASATTANRRNLEILLATTVAGIAVFGIIFMIGTVFLRGVLFSDPMFFYHLANLFCCMLTALALSYLLSLFGKRDEERTGLINSVTLGMSFLCGVFVPLHMLHKNVKMVAQFFPVYWYEHCNELLYQVETVSGNLKIQIIQCLLIQLLFAAAMIVVKMVISHKKQI